MSSPNRFENILDKAKDDEARRCWFCNKSEDDIRAEFLESMQKPENADKEINIDDLIIMSYETKKPICAACYFQLKSNKELVDEIFERPEGDIWGTEEE